MLPAVTKRTLCQLTLILQSLSLAQGQFIPTNTIPVGAGPRFIATADLNNDGRPDLIAANSLANTVTVLLNNGAGAFTEAPGSPVEVGASPQFLAIADFNGDGKPDIATANSPDNTVTVLLGNGAGGFLRAPGSPFGAGAFPQFVAVRAGKSPRSPTVADFDGDGLPDVVTLNSADNTITLLPGNGRSEVTIPAGPTPVSAAAADFNGDGEPDLAVVNAGDNTVTIYRNALPALIPDSHLLTFYASTNGSAPAAIPVSLALPSNHPVQRRDQHLLSCSHRSFPTRWPLYGFLSLYRARFLRRGCRIQSERRFPFRNSPASHRQPVRRGSQSSIRCHGGSQWRWLSGPRQRKLRQ